MCYVVPLAGSFISSAIWGRTKNVKILWLTLLFCGGALFGVIDHLWNGELFLISEKTTSDLILGAAISAAILVCWGIMLAISRFNPALGKCSAPSQ